jgi:peptidoglycan/xylan/chitin deacetylase (PgdA/CDA1 family)
MRAALVLLLIALSPAAPPSRLVTQGNPRIREVALTFDAGADRGNAASILQVLERRHVRATFGMTGRWAMRNPDLVRRMAHDGDAFINHTYDHRSFTGRSSHMYPLTGGQRVWEIWRTEQIVKGLTGRSTKPYFRPPYGDYDKATLSLASRLGYRYVIMWTVDSFGWEGLSPAEILRRCKRLLASGDIYLMHVGSQSRDAAALPGLLRWLRIRGYRAVTVPELLSGA